MYAARTMKRLLLMCVVVASGACSEEGPGPKDEATCGETWITEGYVGSKCDLACEQRPSVSILLGAACDTNVSSQGSTVTCDATFEDQSGQIGCCTSLGGVDNRIGPGVKNEPDRTRRVFFLTCAQ